MGDAHISEKDNLLRFKAMEKVVKKFKPHLILLIGDFLTVDCLSAWDKNKKKVMEGKRFKKEMDKGNMALDIIQGFHKGKIVYLEGNHEDRVERYLDLIPTFDGVVNIPIQLKLAERGIQWVKYKDFVNINGISFIHIPISGNGRPISGADMTGKALKMFNNSVVFGHTHSLKIDHNTRHNSTMNIALNVGCFFEEDHDYTEGTVKDYWKGLVLLETNKPNHFDFTTVSMDVIMKGYDKPEQVKRKERPKPNNVQINKRAFDYDNS